MNTIEELKQRVFHNIIINSKNVVTMKKDKEIDNEKILDYLSDINVNEDYIYNLSQIVNTKEFHNIVIKKIIPIILTQNFSRIDDDLALPFIRDSYFYFKKDIIQLKLKNRNKNTIREMSEDYYIYDILSINRKSKYACVNIDNSYIAYYIAKENIAILDSFHNSSESESHIIDIENIDEYADYFLDFIAQDKKMFKKVMNNLSMHHDERMSRYDDYDR